MSNKSKVKPPDKLYLPWSTLQSNLLNRFWR